MNKVKKKSTEKTSSREKWLFKNKNALNKVRKGLKDSAEGKAVYSMSFRKYVIEDEVETLENFSGLLVGLWLFILVLLWLTV